MHVPTVERKNLSRTRTGLSTSSRLGGAWRDRVDTQKETDEPIFSYFSSSWKVKRLKGEEAERWVVPSSRKSNRRSDQRHLLWRGKKNMKVAVKIAANKARWRVVEEEHDAEEGKGITHSQNCHTTDYSWFLSGRPAWNVKAVEDDWIQQTLVLVYTPVGGVRVPNYLFYLCQQKKKEKKVLRDRTEGKRKPTNGLCFPRVRSWFGLLGCDKGRVRSVPLTLTTLFLCQLIWQKYIYLM